MSLTSTSNVLEDSDNSPIMNQVSTTGLMRKFGLFQTITEKNINLFQGAVNEMSHQIKRLTQYKKRIYIPEMGLDILHIN